MIRDTGGMVIDDENPLYHYWISNDQALLTSNNKLILYIIGCLDRIQQKDWQTIERRLTN